ncbi:unnamed protein product [Phytophthora lilii]|uniref:Unnamed protein product n=1 Tax=Phytophthora lilii TaxID=2077276 RepID=A0A9W6YIM0_9STRA|nr:unnamed protein product [Phytophthora lilii]
MDRRRELSASLSTDALRGYEEVQKRRSVQFDITDILPKENVKARKKEVNSPLGPVSLPRPGRNGALSPNERIPPAAPKAIQKDGTMQTSVAESYAERLEQAENTELFAYASALCHRVTGRYLPRTLLQSDPEAQQRELERVQHDPEILRAIDSVRVLSAQFKDVAQTTMGHRRELGHALFRIEENYLKLFEKLLELSLRLYWEYEHRTEAQRREDRATAERWRDKYERKCDECVKINKKLAAREIIHRAREIELHDFRGQMKDIEKELGNQRGLEAQIIQLQDAAALQRVLERKLRDDFVQLTVRFLFFALHCYVMANLIGLARLYEIQKTHEEMIEYQKQLREEVHFKY